MKYSEWLIKTSIDDFLFDPRASDSAEDLVQLAELRGLCRRDLTSPQSVLELKAGLKDFAASRSVSARVRNVIDEVRDELGEILDDRRFARSSRGRFVLFCNDYVQELYKIIRAQPKFADAYVGAHAEREAVIVAGEVPDEAALDELRAILAAHPPGVEVVWRVTYGALH